MKKVLTPIFLFISTCIFAQKVNEIPLEKLDSKYIVIEAKSKFGRKDVFVQVDYGQISNSIWQFAKEIENISALKNNDDEIIYFSSYLNAINFFAKLNYKWVDTLVNENIDNGSKSNKYVLEKQ